ncbi:MAG: EscU/YscU/HrcU family type III secretion system export apparatus switch protein [Caulobacterales bacterium]
MAESTEQNKTEEATPFKLKRAREKGSVARGVDLGFFSILVGAIVFYMIAGGDTWVRLAATMRRVFLSAIEAASDPQYALAAISIVYRPAFDFIALFAGIVVAVVILAEIVQIRGLVFTAQPLKPDFNRLNPGQNLKRLFSMRLVKETIKSVLKLLFYSAAAYVVARYAFERYSAVVFDGDRIADAFATVSIRLLLLFAVIAFAFAMLDQVLSRQEFNKQMRMSRRELTREAQEREGEPRLKRKRKQLHAEFTKQTKALGDLRGSDMLIVNPEHYAIGIFYDASVMTAPRVTAKGRNRFALLLRRKAAFLSIPIVEAPALARALYKECDKGSETPPSAYAAVADLYLRILPTKARSQAHAQ